MEVEVRIYKRVETTVEDKYTINIPDNVKDIEEYLKENFKSLNNIQDEDNVTFDESNIFWAMESGEDDTLLNQEMYYGENLIIREIYDNIN